MKTNLKIAMLLSIVLGLSSCASMQDSNSDSYFGYNNNPKIESPAPNQAQNVNYPSQRDNYSDYSDYSDNRAINQSYSEPVVEYNYVYFNPVVYRGYYPWWAPQRRWQVVHHRPSVSIGITYSNYDVWDYWHYNHYYPNYYHYGYNTIYYPYPVYAYPYHYPRYYGTGWYNVPRNPPTKEPRTNDTYRDFGPSRGSYGSTGTATETAAPANRRTGSSQPSSVKSDTKTIYDNNQNSGNSRTGSNLPSRSVVGSEQQNDTRSNNNSPSGINAGSNNQNPRSNEAAPSNNRTPSRETVQPPSSGTQQRTAPQRTPAAVSAPTQSQPSRQAAPAPRQSQPSRQATPSRSSTPSRESSGSSEQSSPSNRRTR